MTPILTIHQAGPALSVQDLGHIGYRAQGLSQGGVLDSDAHYAGAAILGQSPDLAALEMIGFGGVFAVSAPAVFAITGASARATLDGQPLEIGRSYAMTPENRLSIGAINGGVASYLHFSGGIDTPPIMGARANHIAGGLGRYLRAGERLFLGVGNARAGRRLPRDQFETDRIWVLPSFQTRLFRPAELSRFEETVFRLSSTQISRQGAALDFSGAPFKTAEAVQPVSNAITVGDIQLVGDGRPFLLLAESQTTGGYPRIANVPPFSLGTILRQPIGSPLRFRFMDYQRAHQAMAEWLDRRAQCARRVTQIAALGENLWSQNLIGGVIDGMEGEIGED